MSVLSECYEVCKIINNLPIREKIKNLITHVRTSSKQDIDYNSDLTSFASIARNYNAQFMGYLIVDLKRAEIEKQLSLKIPSISQNEKELLEKAHNILRYFNKHCIDFLIKKIPNLSQALDPYSEFEYPTCEKDINDVIDTNVFLKLFDSIKNSQAVNIIFSSPIGLLQKIPMQHYTKTCMEFIRRIDNSGVHAAPEGFRELALPLVTDKNNPEFIVSKVIFAVMSLRKMIYNINQLFFQKFFMDKLVVFNQNNIININQQNKHTVGEGITLLVQPMGNELFSDVRDIILIKMDIKQYNINKLCSVEGIKIDYNKELGFKQEFILRVLNDELNPFFGLLN